jgi:hypothetical protein
MYEIGEGWGRRTSLYREYRPRGDLGKVVPVAKDDCIGIVGYHNE